MEIEDGTSQLAPGRARAEAVDRRTLMQLRILGPQCHDVHPAWCRLLRTVFTRVDFARWVEWGQWDESYRAYTLFDGDQPVANASLTRMRLVLDGDERRGWQFGAVCVHPTSRGAGHARLLIETALADCGDEPVWLFGNPRVREFYPRFGFAPREEWVFGAEHACDPASTMAARLDPQQPETRALIHRLAADGLPCSARFGARGHGAVINWYLANGLARAPLQPLPGVLVFCEQLGDCLTINEVLGGVDVDLAALLPQLIDAPIARLRFGFTPERLWPTARAIAVDPEPDLLVRGFAPSGPHKFPLLAQT